jgi:DNA-directed RNA polymerase sigma subunit (sigma70/sigma32)
MNDFPEHFFSVLDEREKFVIDNRLGLHDCDAITLREVGSKLGIGKDRVRQLQSIALSKLRRLVSLDDEGKLRRQADGTYIKLPADIPI